jgi:hypothetical protein
MIGNIDLDLLEKTYQNAKIGITAIEEVLDKASDTKLIQDLKNQLKDYSEIANKAKEELVKNGAEVKEKPIYDRAMMRGNIKMNLWMEPTDSKIADMVIKGSTMGMTQMTKLINDKKDADGSSVQIAKEFVKKEENNIETMKAYL